MSATVKFLILYLIAILSFASIFGVYMLAYGKPLDNPLIDFAFTLIILSFIASCFITVNLVSHFLSNETIYTGIVFSILASLLQAVVILLYLIVFYGFFNP
ncbi:MAG: hypothetical protein ACI9RG_000705 [Sulfurimonas sp.]|jgi:hypothetical protein